MTTAARDQQRHQDHFDHRSSKLAQSKGKEEERAGRTEAQSWPGTATNDFPTETSQETLKKGRGVRGGGGQNIRERKGRREGWKGKGYEGERKERQGVRGREGGFNINQRW